MKTIWVIYLSIVLIVLNQLFIVLIGCFMLIHSPESNEFNEFIGVAVLVS
jgi:hypothetical protein